MEYRPLGRTGVMVSSLCLGGMGFGGPTSEEESITIINLALEAGINFIDTANVYNAGESERIVGKALKENGGRAQVVLATKVSGQMGHDPNDGGVSRYHIIKACEDSLRRLQTDHLDLYQLHYPFLAVPQDETLRAFDALISAGKVLYIGCSNHPAWAVMESLAISERYGLASYISVQPPYNLLDRRVENALVPLCQKYNLAILPWSPLACGILANRYPPGDEIPEDSRAARVGWGQLMQTRLTRKGREVGAQLAKMAQKRGMTAAQLALLWVKDQPGVTSLIIGPRTLRHLEDSISVPDMSLDDADRPLFDEMVHPGNAVSDFHNSSKWMKARIFG